MGTLNKVYINSPENNGEFEFQAQNIDYTIPGSTIKTSVASVLKNLTEQTGDEGLAPTDHSSETSEYGMASTSKYGHIKIGEGLIGPQGSGGFDTLPFTLQYGRGKIANNYIEGIGECYVFIGNSATTKAQGEIKIWLLDQNGFSQPPITPLQIKNFDGYVTYSSDDSFAFIGDSDYPNVIRYYNCIEQDWSSRTISFDLTTENSVLLSDRNTIMVFSEADNGYIFITASGSRVGIPPLEISTSISYLGGDYFFSKEHPPSCFVVDRYNNNIWFTEYQNNAWGSWQSSSIPTSKFQLKEPTVYYNAETDAIVIISITQGVLPPFLSCEILNGGTSQASKLQQTNYSTVVFRDKVYAFAPDTSTDIITNTLVYSYNALSNIWERDGLPITPPEDSGDIKSISTKAFDDIHPAPGPIPGPDPNALTIDPKYALDSDDERLEDERTPFPHASLDTRYGASTVNLYGHSKLVDDYANVGLNIGGGSSVTISELSTVVWQRHNVAVNKNGEILAISALDFSESQWSPAYSFYSSTNPIVENQRHPVIYDLDSCQVECLNDDTFIVVGSYSPSYAGLYMYKTTNDQWTRLSDLPFDFFNSSYSGQIAKDIYRENYENSVLIMLYNSNLSGYVFYWYNEEDGLIPAFEEGDYLPISYIDDGNTIYLNSYNLTLVITPSYYVVLDIYNQRMWKRAINYSEGWSYSDHLLPTPALDYSYPSALVYRGNDMNTAYLHIVGRNNNGGIFHSTFDLFNMYWDEANTENVSLRGYDSYNGEYSLILRDNKLYLFTDTNQNTTKIYSCRADTMNPVWVEDSITFGSKPSSRTCGGNGISASSYSVNMFKNDTLKRIATIMPKDDFTDELQRRMEKYIKSS